MTLTNLDLYRRGKLPGLPESQTKYLQAELSKLERQAASQFDKFTLLDQDVAGTRAELEQERIVRADADGALAADIETLTATAGANTAAITAEISARASADTALAQSITTLSGTVGSNSAAITAEQTARANADSSLATQISTVQSNLGTTNASVSTLSSSLNGVKARWGVTIDNNGFISGVSLLSDTSGNPTSVFRVTANQFAIRAPGAGTDSVYWDSGTSKLVVRGDIQATSLTTTAVVLTSNLADNSVSDTYTLGPTTQGYSNAL